MSERFDPAVLQTEEGGLPMTTTEPPPGLTAMLEQQRHAFSGLEALPVDEPDLPGQDQAALGAEEPPTPADAVLLEMEPGTPAAEPTRPPLQEEMAQRLALLEAELAAMRATAPPPVLYSAPATPAAPVAIGEDVYTRIGERFERAFASMEEQRAEEDDRAFAQRRGRSFAETIVQAVYEDLLPHEAVQERFRPLAEQIAQAVSQQTVSQARQADSIQSSQDRLVMQAVDAARVAGYDVHLPGTPAHTTSKESRLFWGVATQIDPALPGDQQIAEALSLMPAKAAGPTPAPQTPAPTASRPQPMGRGGATPPPRTGEAGAAGDYQPMTMHHMIQHGAQTRRLGAA